MQCRATVTCRVWGVAVIWDALKGAAESDSETAKVIFDSAGIVVGPPDLTTCYDERGTSSLVVAYAHAISPWLPTIKMCQQV